VDKQTKEKKIFLIEDDNIDIMVFKRAMKQLDIAHSLTIFTNGEEFLNYFEDFTFLEGKNPQLTTYSKTGSVGINIPDILFLDLNTNRMNGLELLQVLAPKRENLFFPIVVLSTSGDETDIRTAYKYHVNGYITKSISFNVFVENLQIVIKYWDTVKIPKGINNE